MNQNKTTENKTTGATIAKAAVMLLLIAFAFTSCATLGSAVDMASQRSKLVDTVWINTTQGRGGTFEDVSHIIFAEDGSFYTVHEGWLESTEEMAWGFAILGRDTMLMIMGESDAIEHVRIGAELDFFFKEGDLFLGGGDAYWRFEKDESGDFDYLLSEADEEN